MQGIGGSSCPNSSYDPWAIILRLEERSNYLSNHAFSCNFHILDCWQISLHHEQIWLASFKGNCTCTLGFQLAFLVYRVSELPRPLWHHSPPSIPAPPFSPLPHSKELDRLKPLRTSNIVNPPLLWWIVRFPFWFRRTLNSKRPKILKMPTIPEILRSEALRIPPDFVDPLDMQVSGST